MRIIHYMHDMWSPGGVATYIRRLSERQRADGNEVVFTDSMASRRHPDVTLVETGVDIAHLARSTRADVVHLHLMPPGGTPLGVPVIRTVHGHQMYCPSGTQYLPRAGHACERPDGLLRCTWGHLVDHCGSRRPSAIVGDFRRIRDERRDGSNCQLVAISNFVRQRLLRAGYAEDRVSVLHNPAPNTDVTWPVHRASLPRFLFMGRAVEGKGVSWLLEALAQTPSSLNLDIASDGPAIPRLRHQVQRTGLAERVTFHGWLAEKELGALIARSWAVVVPSIWHEPFGLAAVEASAHGRAVIASTVGGLSEVVLAGETGLTVSPGDTAGLVAALTRIAGDPGLADRLGDHGNRRATTLFSLRTHTDRLAELYEAAM